MRVHRRLDYLLTSAFSSRAHSLAGVGGAMDGTMAGTMDPTTTEESSTTSEETPMPDDKHKKGGMDPKTLACGSARGFVHHPHQRSP